MATQTPTLPAESRDKVGSRYSHRLREAGRVPAVLYGHGEQPSHLHLDRHELTKLVHHGAHLLELTLAGKSESCLIKSIQYDHLGDEIVHLDLTRVDLTEDVELEIELQLEGEPKALEAEGAILSHPVQSLNIKCRANVIPENIVLRIDDLTTDRPITVADVTPPPGVTLLDDPETVLASITIVQEMPEEEEPEAAEGEEPEVIGKAGEQEGEAGEEETE